MAKNVNPPAPIAAKLSKQEAFHPMPGAFTICMVMSWSGYRTAGTTTMKTHLQMDLPGSMKTMEIVKDVYCAVAPGVDVQPNFGPQRERET